MTSQVPENQRDSTDGCAQQTDGTPSPAFIGLGCRHGAECAAYRVEAHVRADRAALGVRARGKDQALTGDMNGLDGEVEQNHATGKGEQ